MSFSLVSLELNNFKKHADLSVEFADGLTVIRGPNWAGKSTVLQGVLFALFGSYAVPGKKEHLTRKGSTKMSVLLTIRTSEGLTQIRRTPSSALVTSGGVDLASGASSVDEWVSNLLGIDRKVALQLAVSPQTQTAALLTLGVPTINRLVESLSGADAVETMIGKATHKKDDLLKKRDGLFVANIESIQLEITAKTDTLNDLKASEAEAGEEVRELEGMVSAQSVEMTAVNQTKMRIEQAKRAYGRHQKSVELEKKYLDQIEKAREALDLLPAARLEPLEKEIDALRARQKEALKIDARRSELEKWFTTTGKSWQEGEELLPELEKTLEQETELEGELTRLAEAHGLAREGLAAAKSDVERCVEAVNTGICSACLRSFEGHDHADAEAKLDEARTMRDKLQIAERAVNAKKESQITKLSEVRKQLAFIQKKLPPEGYEAEYNRRLEELEGLPTTQDFEPAIQTQEANLKAARKVISERSNWEDNLRYSNESLTKARQDAQDALAESEGHDSPVPDTDALESEWKRLNQMLTKALAARDAAMQARVRAETGLETSQKALEAARVSLEQQAQLEAKAERWAAFVKWLRDNKARLLGTLWDSILSQASQFLAEATNGVATELLRSDDGEFAILEDGLEMPVSSVSGGMAAIAGTALKLALVELLPTAPGFLLLDEPSSELNDENAAALASALRGQGRQIVLVTHRTGEEYLADAVVSLD